MLTPADIRNPARKSGYAQVDSHRDKRPGRTNPNPYHCYAGRGRRGDWRGPRRATALEAAQDYCDYENSGRGVATKPPKVRTPPKPTLNLQRANHPRRATATEGPRVPRFKSNLRAVRTNGMPSADGFVYLIGITGHAEYVKVGWSSRSGFPRLNELQTGNPLLLVGLAEFPGTLQDEYNLHAAHEANNVLNEWFHTTPDLLSEFDLTWNQHCSLVNDIYSIDTEGIT